MIVRLEVDMSQRHCSVIRVGTSKGELRRSKRVSTRHIYLSSRDWQPCRIRIRGRLTSLGFQYEAGLTTEHSLCGRQRIAKHIERESPHPCSNCKISEAGRSVTYTAHGSEVLDHDKKSACRAGTFPVRDWPMFSCVRTL